MQLALINIETVAPIGDICMFAVKLTKGKVFLCTLAEERIFLTSAKSSFAITRVQKKYILHAQGVESSF